MGRQLGVQAIGVLATIAWSGGLSYVLLKLIDAAIGLRVDAESETTGLDISLHDNAQLSGSATRVTDAYPFTAGTGTNSVTFTAGATGNVQLDVTVTTHRGHGVLLGERAREEEEEDGDVRGSQRAGHAMKMPGGQKEFPGGRQWISSAPNSRTTSSGCISSARRT